MASIFGQAVTLTATVSPGSATGNVTFYDETAILGSASLTNGTAVLSTTGIAYGIRHIKARYIGDVNNSGSLSATVIETVTTQGGGGFVTAPGQLNFIGSGRPHSVVAADLNHDGHPDLIVSNENYPISQTTVSVFLNNGDGTFGAAVPYLDGNDAVSVAVADVDLDGNPDILVSEAPGSQLTGAGLFLLKGKGDGTFPTDTVVRLSKYGGKIGIADFNADGYPDLVVTNSIGIGAAGTAISVLLGNGDGTFQALPDFDAPVAISDLVVGDFNGDGIADLALSSNTGFNPGSVVVMMGNGDGTFGTPASYNTGDAVSLAAADVNHDGVLDLIAGNYNTQSLSILPGNSNGTFRQAITSNFTPGPPGDYGSDACGCAVTVTDVDGDGNPDIIFALGISYGNGDGTFRTYVPFGSSPSATIYPILAVADLNGDGIADIATPTLLLMGHPSPVLSVTATPEPAQAEQPLTLTVTASRPDATGTISVMTDSYPTTVGTAVLVNGSATVVQNQAQPGSNYFWASYSGDSKYAATESPEIYVLAQRPGPTVTLTATPNPAVLGQAVTLTATLSQSIGNGQVSFYDGAALLNSQTLYGNSATITVYLTPGIHQLNAIVPQYQGYTASSASVTEQVNENSGGQLGNGVLYATVAGAPGALAVMDPNNDGIADLVVANTTGQTLDLYLGDNGSVRAPVGLYLGFTPGALATIPAVPTRAFSGQSVLVTDPADNLLYTAGFGNFNSTTPSFLNSGIPVGTQPVAVATADFNNDGVADAVTANAGSNDVTLLTSNTSNPIGRTDIPAGNHPDAIVTGDFNNDGQADFAVANRDDNNVMIFAGNGDSTFQAPVTVSLGVSPAAIAAGDLNGDGKLDLVVVSAQAGQVIVLLGNGNGTFRNSANYSAPGAASVAVGAFGNTAAPALAVTASTGLLVFSGNGDGTFSAPAGFPQYAGAAAVVTGNFSPDQRMELAIGLPAANSIAYIYKDTGAAPALSVSPNPLVAGQRVSLTVNVSPSSTLGAVTYYDGTAPIGSAVVSNGQAVFQTNMLTPGSHMLSARFLNSPGIASARTSTVTLGVSPVRSLGLTAPIRQTLANSPYGLVPGDFNGDGKLDFAFGPAGSLASLIGNGDGTFQERAPSAWGGNLLVAGDFNNDGKTDIAAGGGSPTVSLGSGNGNFDEMFRISTATENWISKEYGATRDQPAAMATTDVNGDGIFDLILANSNGSADVLFGAGDGTFQLARNMQLGTNLTAVVTADVNRDGIADLLTTDSATGLIVATGQGDGTFTTRDVQIPAMPVALAVADFTGDNKPDAAIAHTSPNQLSIFAGGGDGSFSAQGTIPLPATPNWLSAADINGDGRTDLVVGFTAGNPAFAVFYGNGDGTFQAPLTFSVPDTPQAMAIGDVNNDGRPDVVIGTYSFAAPYAKTLDVFLGTGVALSVLQGSGQSAQIGATFQQAMQVSAPNGTMVTFTAPASGAGGSFAGSLSVTVTASSGVAAAPSFTANSVAGTYSVIASAAGVANASIALTNTPGPATTVSVASGSSQSASIGTSYASPLQALVRDANGNPVPNVTVTFTAPGSGASIGFGGPTTVTAASNAAGIATSPPMTANGTAGPVTVTATIATSPSAGFVLTNITGVQVTITTAQAGPVFSVDGAAYDATRTFMWNAGDTHTVSVAQTQTLSNVQYLFNSWSDGGSASHQITVPASATTLTASFQTQYLFTASPGPGGAISPATGFYNAGTLTVTAIPNAGYTFASFSGAVNGSINPQSFNLAGPQTAYATFESQSPQLSVTVVHNGSFAQGQNGAAYTINVGDASNAPPTKGTVTLTESLPAGVTLVSISGGGFTCTGASCTRSTPIPSVPSVCCYQLTVTVNIAPNAPLQLVNRVTVSGGGSASATAADTASLGPFQSISFAPIGSVTYGIAPFTVSATASSGLPVTLQTADTTVCTVSSMTVTITGGGVCTLTATQAGNSSFGAATGTRSFLINPTTQTVSFSAPPRAAVSPASMPLNATASSGLAVYYGNTNPFACFINGSSVTFQRAGVCTITAIQPGNASYLPATTPQTVIVGQLQSITFNAPGAIPMSPTPLTLSATATSGLTVAFVSTTTTVCTVSGNLLTLVSAGTCSITATQTGNADYAPALPVIRSLTINPASTGGGGGIGPPVNPLMLTPSLLTFNSPIAGSSASQTVSLADSKAPESFYASVSFSAQPVGWLSVSPASGTTGAQTTLTVTVNPAGLAAGTYTGAVNVGTNTNFISATVTLTVQAVPATVTVAPSALNFAYQLGASSVPPEQSISVFSKPSGVSFTATASSNGNWLLASPIGTPGATPGSVAVSVSVGSLAAGTYTGKITIASPGATSVDVPVTIAIAAASPPSLSVSPGAGNLTAAQGSSPVNGQVTVSNTGGGTLQFTAASDQGWLSLVTTSGSATPSNPASLAFTANPAGLNPGLYTGHIAVSVSSPASQSVVTVLLTVTKAAQYIQLSQTGVAITAVSGGAAPKAQALTVANSGAGSLSWTAQAATLSGGSWLQVTPTSGASASGQPGTQVSISANATGLAAGQYYGSVNIVAPNAVNNPQTVSVVLSVVSSQASPGVTVSAGGVILTGVAGSATPAQQTVTAFNPSSAAIAYSASTFSGTGWLSVSPATGSVSPGANSIRIAANLSGLTAGVQTGTVRLAFGDGSTATIQVVALATGSTAKASALQPRALTACRAGQPSFLIPIFQQPVAQAAVQVAAPQIVEVDVIDDCGNPVTAQAGGSLQVTFSSGDAGIDLHDTGSGIWTATWTPVNAAAQVTLQVEASEQGITLNPSLNAASSVTVTVPAATAASAPQPTGIANAASAAQAPAQVVAPGSYVAIYGTGLAGNGSPLATSLPLPTTLNGTQLFLGGLPMPLLYASAGQVNALVPQGILPNASYPLTVVMNGTTESVPVSLTVTELQPGIYTATYTGSGAGIVTNAVTGQLIDASHPAHAADYLTIYCTGLGALTGPNGQAGPGDGAAAPASPLFQTTATVTATVGGVNAPVQFSGLTPTLAALYQVNVQVPAGVTAGSAVPVAITAADPQTGITAQSNPVTITVQ